MILGLLITFGLIKGLKQSARTSYQFILMLLPLIVFSFQLTFGGLMSDSAWVGVSVGLLSIGSAIILK